MHFDLTKEVTLDKKNYALYKKWQMAVYLLAVVMAFYLAYLVIFPTQHYQFSFANPNSTQNNIIDPRDKDKNFADHGNVSAQKELFFDSALGGNYSQAVVSFTLDKDVDLLESANVSAKKSFRAFLYPQGDGIGFRNGSLLKVESDYYIVSQDQLRRFSTPTVLDALGFNKNAFVEASENDIRYNKKGEDVGSSYPDGSIFKINDEYYLLQDQKLKKFISTQAYQTFYSENQALPKNEDFLKNYPLDENLLGFADGTLISYGISAFIVSSGKVLPINNTITFTLMGYDWSDLIPASGDEVSLYQKDRLFTIDSAHPDGTIMVTDTNDWYIIIGGQKHPLASPLAARTWSRNNPIIVSEKSLETETSCTIEKNILSARTYSCSIPLDDFQEIIGKDYEFKFVSDSDTKIDSINVDFKKSVNLNNMKLVARSLISKIKGNYVEDSPLQ